jgi:hypothetical protein
VAVKPAARPAPKPAAKPAPKPTARPIAAAKPATKAATKPATSAKPRATTLPAHKVTTAPRAGGAATKGKPKATGKAGTTRAKTVKGKADKSGAKAHAASSYTQSQQDVINTYLRIGYDLKAPDLAIEAALCAGSGENNWSNDGCNSSNHCGAWQISGTLQQEKPYSDLEYWTTEAYTRGFYQPGVSGDTGGLIGIAKANPTQTPGWCANVCQGAYADLAAGAQYYDQFAAEARQIMKDFGHGAPAAKSTAPTAPTTTSTYPGGVDLVAKTPLTSDIEKFDYAGDWINAWKYLADGIDKANQSAKTHYNTITAITYVKPATAKAG